MQKHPLILARSTRNANNVNNRSELSKRSSDRINSREFANSKGSADSTETTKASICVSCITCKKMSGDQNSSEPDCRTCVQLVTVSDPPESTGLYDIQCQQIEISWKAMKGSASQLYEPSEEVLCDVDLTFVHVSREVSKNWDRDCGGPDHRNVHAIYRVLQVALLIQLRICQDLL
jgi:hypothetical protein